MSVAQDGQGFIWLATRNGLNRYDGHAFRIYKNIPGEPGSLANNYVNTLFCDSRHRLWIGTNSGLDRYDPVNDSFVHVNSNSISGRPVNAIGEDRAGGIWIGTPYGLGWIGIAGGIAPPPLTGMDVRTFFEDTHGDMWIGTVEGIKRLTLQRGRWLVTSFIHTSAAGSLSNNYVSTFVEDNQGQLWIGTHGGLDLYHPASGSFTITHPLLQIRKIIRDRKGKLWIGALEGLTVLDPATGKDTSYKEDPENRHGLSHNSIYSLFQDAGATIWIGTYFGGANIVYSYTTPFTVYQNSKFHSSVSNNVISAFAEDAGHLLYIGTEGGGMNILDRSTGTFTVLKDRAGDPTSLGSNLVKIIYRDRAGRIWVGTHDGGLRQFDPGSRRFTCYPARQNGVGIPESEIDAIVEDRSGHLWVGSQAGLRLLKGAEVVEAGGAMNGLIKKRAIHTLFEDSHQDLWVGTTSGLFVFSSEGRPALTFPESSGLSIAYINCVQEDTHHRIWIGRYYGGLSVYDPVTGKIMTYTEKDGLANNNVIGILEDGKGYIWISTDNGLCRLDPDRHQFFTYTASDGLAANGFNYNSYFRDRQGKMYFGGYNGFTTFFPDSIETNQYIAPVVFTGLRLFNVPIRLHTDPIVFHHDENVFTLDFALLNYTKPDKNRYEYRLLGFDKGWNEVTASSATYTNLPAGDYTFEVKGANNDGVWSSPAIWHIRILPPFWATWWAYCLYVVLTGVIIFFITRFFFLRALLKRDYELHQVKLNFFTNVSHEIRTHLTLISGPVEKMLGMEKNDSFLRQQLQYVRSSADRLLRLVEELMDFRKAETNHLKLNPTKHNIVGFVRGIYGSFEEGARTRGIDLSFAADRETIELSFDKEQMEKVFFNLLTNAFKFTPDGGTIAVELEQRAQQVEIRIADNGKGIAPEHVKKLFVNFFQVGDHSEQNTGYGIGLALSKSIVKLHKGDLTVESRLAAVPGGNRTCFTVTLPLDGERTTVRRPAGGRYTLLITEDNAELRSFLVQSLEGTYDVIACENGLAAWETAIEQIPDLVISDVMMPGLDGLTLCSRLKADNRTSHIPVILLTARAAHEHQVSGLETGADIYLIKPFSIQVLELHIHNLIATREAMRQKFTPQVVLQPHETAAGISEDPFLEKLTRFIEENMANPEFSVPWLSEKMEMSQPVLYKKVKAVTNMSVNDFIKFIRLQKAAQLLQGGESVQHTAGAIGFADTKYFSREFKKQFGRSPSEYAKAG